MRKHILIPFCSLVLFFSIPAFAKANTNDPIKTPKKSSQKANTAKYEFSLFQITYNLLKEKKDTVNSQNAVIQRKENEN